MADEANHKLDNISVPKIPGKEEYDKMMSTISDFQTNIQKIFSFFNIVLMVAIVCQAILLIANLAKILLVAGLGVYGAALFFCFLHSRRLAKKETSELIKSLGEVKQFVVFTGVVMLAGTAVCFILSALDASVLLVELLLFIVYAIPICIILSNKDIRDKVSEIGELQQKVEDLKSKIPGL